MAGDMGGTAMENSWGLQNPVGDIAPKGPRVLVVDDDRVTRELLRGSLEREGYAICIASSGEQALEMLRTGEYAVVLSDVQMLQLDGFGLLAQLKKGGQVPVMILMTGFGTLEGAIEAIHEGAFDYLSKPFRPEELRSIVRRAVQHSEMQRDERGRTRHLTEVPLLGRTLIGKSPKMVQVYKTLARATLTGSNVLINGESGTGKELVAKAIHDNSSRKGRTFVTVNCGALTDTLLESELFGHIKGSFTGAIANKRGLFEEADGGTIFLDEIGDITPALQVKLLRVIQEGEFKPVGSTEVRRVDARIIAATHRDLDVMAREGRFREDLYYRLKVIAIHLPALRERMEDLPDLVRHFVARYAEKTGKPVVRISREAMSLLYSYPWPGNIRELENAIERAFAMTNTTVLYPDDFPAEVASHQRTDAKPGSVVESEPMEMAKSLEQMERAHIVRILQEVNFNKSKAADILGIDRAPLYRKA